MCRIQRAVWIRSNIRGKIMGVLKTLFLLVIAITFCQPVYAVTKCVKLNSSTTCSDFSGEYNQSNWSATCGGVSIQGVAFCGSQDGGETGATTDAVTTSTTSDNNKYCWCKMVSPAVSRWVFTQAITPAGYCANNCAFVCAGSAQSSASFRSALFSGLGD